MGVVASQAAVVTVASIVGIGAQDLLGRGEPTFCATADPAGNGT